MRRFAVVFFLVFSFISGTFLSAQTYVSVPVNHPVYYLLDQAEARGLCSPLPAVKPYTRARVVDAINEILAAEPGRFGKLTDSEREILEDARKEFTKGEPGLDLWKGMYRFDVQGKKGGHFSGDVGIALDSLNSGAYYTDEKKTYLGTDTWGTFFFKGDVGNRFSFNVDFSGGLMRAQRDELGTYDTYATELDPDPTGEFVNQRVITYSQPLAFFPYTYQKKWDGFMFGSGAISAGGMKFWPNGFSIAPSMLAEMSGSVFNDMLLLRFGRMQREWGAMMPGSSLVFNAAARPFLGMEAIFTPAPWFAFSSLTGVLEFYNGNGGIYDAANTFQNAFSIGQMELNIGDRWHFDFGSEMIWPKRFELGYIFPLLDNFLYQNFVGKTDNAAIHFNIKYRYPGLGTFWGSLFVDEVEVSSIKKAFKLDRHMFAYQVGVQGIIPGVPFASVSLSYTKIEPYNYTHHRNYVPWYDSSNGPMEKAYVNNGVSLGYYLPPNSDEVKVRFDVHPLLRMAAHWQYQLIRHGADYGPHQVDGSSLISELDPSGRGDKASLTKAFLKDGAYQWMHIIKIGADYKFGAFPLTLYGEAGLVYSYFTDISQAEYDSYHPTPAGETPRTPADGVYIKSTAYILTLGFKIFW